MKNSRQVFGSFAEKEAEKYLKKKGYSILEKNFSTPLGEIDLIVEKDGILIFVEVKAGKQDSDFSPAVHYNFQKQKKLLQLAKFYEAKTKFDQQMQFDLVVVTQKEAQLQIDHLEDVIQDTEL